MSSSTTTTPDTSSTSSAGPAQTSTGGFISTPQNQATFYRNLFYILIGLLGFFALISLLSLLRARRRRLIVIAEATRLGVLVPGMEGYVTLRERENARWLHKDGTISPDWWEIGAERWMRGWGRGGASASAPAGPVRGYLENGKPFESRSTSWNAVPTVTYSSTPEETGIDHTVGVGNQRQEWLDTSDLSTAAAQFHPLGVVPPITAMSTKRKKPIVSTLPFFPTPLAYRAEDLLPPPPKWDSTDIETLQELSGNQVDIVTIIKMPSEEVPREQAKRVPSGQQGQQDDEEEEDGEEVLREWGGMCIGVTRFNVQADAAGGMRTEEQRISQENSTRKGRLNVGKARDLG